MVNDNDIETLKEETKKGILRLLEPFAATEAAKGAVDLLSARIDAFDWSDPERFRSDAFDFVEALESQLRQRGVEEEALEDLLDAVYDHLLNRASYGMILKEERRWIREKREEVGDSGRDDPPDDLFGLALSGGGIRSATFNLGLLQSLQRYGILKKVDYLSTVSGGGYIGASMTWIRSVRPDIENPFGATRRDYDGVGGRVLAWLRDYGNYLSPGQGLTFWSFVGAFLGSMLVNLLILAPIFVLAVYLLYATAPWHIFAVIGAIIGLLYLFEVGLYALRPIFGRPDFQHQRRERITAGNLLMAALMLLLIGAVPAIHAYLQAHLQGWIDTLSFSAVAAGVASFVKAYRTSRSSGGEPKGLGRFLLSAGVVLVLFGAVVWIYHLFAVEEIGIGPLPLLGAALLLAAAIFALSLRLKGSMKVAFTLSGILLIGWYLLLFGPLEGSQTPAAILFLLVTLPLSALFAAYTKINYVGMHRYYRNRLMEAYFPWRVIDVKVEEADRFYLTKMDEPSYKKVTPYPIINTNVNMVGSARTRQRERGGDNFILTPLFCGSDITGYRQTKRYADGKMNLATAFAISGAAVDPNTYATRSKPIAFVMSLLNARLGYWIENPRRREGADRIGWSYYLCIFKELFGSGLNEKETYIHLADGGHFENLGLYELIRRRCRYIIVSDAGKDPDFTFGDLAKIIELARVDFGAEIVIDTQPLHPHGPDRLSDAPFVHGTIAYADGTKGDLLYLKTTLVADLPEDIYSYRRTDPLFPDQSTADQFFDERQFEAYRELGYQLGKRLCRGEFQSALRPIFEAVPESGGKT
ncbi:hypothetical protein [Hydrogenimonas sp.]